MVRTAGLEPARDCSLRIFMPLRLSPPRDPRKGTRVRGLDYPFTLAKGRRCCPSSLYTFPGDRAWLGIGTGADPSVPRL